MSRRQKLTILMTMSVVWVALGLYSDGLVQPFILKDTQGAPWALRTFLFKPGLVLASLLLPAAWFAAIAYGAWSLFRYLLRERKPR